MNSESTNSYGDIDEQNSVDNSSEWDSLTNSDDNNEAKNREHSLERLRLYRKVGKVALALATIKEQTGIDLSKDSKEGEDKSEEERIANTMEALNSIEDEQADALFAQIEGAIDEVDRSIKFQRKRHVVNHNQINTPEEVEQELQSGTGTPELDIRFDKDGKPWISHSPRSGARFLFSKPIHEMSSEEVAAAGGRLSLEDGLKIFQKYYKDNPDHRLVLELKELGPSKESAEKYLENIKGMLEDAGITEATHFATLSPSILQSVHDKFPNNPKILNGGIAPVFSHKISENTLRDDHSTKEFRVAGPGWDITFSDSVEYHDDRHDGYGKQTGYLWARLPKETVDTLAEMNKNGVKGAVSLAVVYMYADVLKKVNPKAAEAVLERYAKHVNKLGLVSQTRAKNADDILQTDRINKRVGNDESIIYMNKKVYEAGRDLAAHDQEERELENR